MNENENSPNSGGVPPDENPPATTAELATDELMFLASVRDNDLRLFLSAITARGWLDDSRMKLCKAVRDNDLRAFLMALQVDKVLDEHAAKSEDAGNPAK